MKSVTDVLHRTPWWALIFAAIATLVALAIFVTPYHILQYRDDAKSRDESRAIQREIDNAFAENAISVGRNVVRGMLARTKDPDRRAELEEALAGLEEAREELRLAGTEALRARKETMAAVKEAQRTTLEAVRKARRETEAALKEVDPADKSLRKQLEESLKSAQKAERDAETALNETRGKRITIGPKSGKPAIDIELDVDTDGAKPATPAIPEPPGGFKVPPPPLPGEPAATPPAPPQLAPEVATKIRRDVTGDMYRMGIGAGLVFILLPLFILALVTKFFADRSRASQKVAEAKRKEADYARMAQQVTEAKLSALQAQVEPHFLYNTLASVQALTEVDPGKANEMTGHLIQYLRNALPKMRESVSTVGQEVELVRAYLSILQMRMGPRLAFEIDVPDSLKSMPFPPLMLPSLVENSIKHGLEPQREGGTVKISAFAEDGRLRMVVADTGRGFGETVGAGVGLANIRERLAALYGDAAHFTLVANEPRGVVATIEVPAEGTRAANAAAASAAAAEAEAQQAAAMVASQPAVKVVRTGFWPQTWDTLMVLERLWRKALYYLYLGLLVVAGAIAVGAFVGVAVGAIPVVMGTDPVSQPLAVLIALAGALIGFIAAAAALAIAMLVLYALGWVALAVVLIVAVSLAIGLSPLFAPFVLFGLVIWWWSRRRKAKLAARVEPTMHAAPPAEPPPIPPATEPGR
jgi:hypothetical protein